MDRYGFVKVAVGLPHVSLGNPRVNIERIYTLYKQASDKGAEVIVFPELSITGYTCADLFGQNLLINEAEISLSILCGQISSLDTPCMAVVGVPVRHKNKLYNCAAVIGTEGLIALIPKVHVPNYSEFYERRWFASWESSGCDPIRYAGYEVMIGTHQIVEHLGAKYGVEICEDLWVPVSPSCGLALAGADIILNLSASDEVIGKHDYLISLVKSQSARLRCGYVYSSAGQGESSTDLVFAGNAIVAEDGKILEESPRFSSLQGEKEEYSIFMASIDVEKMQRDRLINSTYSESSVGGNRYEVVSTNVSKPEGQLNLPAKVDAMPFVPKEGAKRDERCLEVVNIQTAGLMQRLRATGCKHLVVGISGGLDSTLALLIAVRAFKKLGLDLKGIHGITMPGFGTTDRTHSNALVLMERLGISIDEIGIGKAVIQHFEDIGHDVNVHDVTYENSQARERTQILMDYANKVGGMVLGTGDLSELALGWCTYNGDHMSMYGINASVPKTLVKHLVRWIALENSDEQLRRVLLDVVDTPISPELTPADDNGEIAQKTEDLVGPYELHDFFLYHTLRNGFSPKKVYELCKIAFEERFADADIKHWMIEFYRRFFNQQFKRSCMPDGPKTGSVSLSPRGDWRMPSDATSRLWLAEVEKL